MSIFQTWKSLITSGPRFSRLWTEKTAVGVGGGHLQFLLFWGSPSSLSLNQCHLWGRFTVKLMKFRLQGPRFHRPLPRHWERPQWSFVYNFVFFIFIYLFLKIYLFLAALGLRCCVRAFSSCGERGLLFVAVRGLLTAVVSLVAEHGL